MSRKLINSTILILLLSGSELPAQNVGISQVADLGDSVSIRLVDIELKLAIQMLTQYLDRPVVFGAVGSQLVTVESAEPVARSRILPLLRSILESQGHELVDDSLGGVWRVQQLRIAPPERPRGGIGSSNQPELFVIKLTHARAGDVAATVNALYGRASALGETTGPPPTLGEQLKRDLVTAAPPPPEVVAGAAGRIAALTGDVTIVPDPGTNSLLIRASRDDFKLIQAAVQELDVRPLQVLIEVTIAEMRRDRSWDFGVGTSLEETGVGGSGTTVSGQIEGGGLGDLIIRAMRIGGGELNAILTASAARGDAKILSRPVVLAANNEEAVISVGSQRPFIQVSRSLPTDTPFRDQVVQFRDVGTSLTVRPTISSNGYITLEVSQEVNAATSETAFDAPVISTRSVHTQLLVRDSQTVVLGGLIDTQREDLRSGVPILSSIPIVGGLFGRQSRRHIETELFLFITPRILRSDDDAAAATETFRERHPH